MLNLEVLAPSLQTSSVILFLLGNTISSLYVISNESESYEQVVDGMELQSTVNGSEEVEAEGRGKRRRVANTQYKDF
jgi:hypothetical protein